MNKLTEKKTKERAELVARERELSKIKISKEDVDLMVRIVHIHFINLSFCLEQNFKCTTSIYLFDCLHIQLAHGTIIYLVNMVFLIIISLGTHNDNL